MGAMNFWNPAHPLNDVTHLGTFYAPHSGIVFADGDVLIGLCGEEFTQVGGTCADTFPFPGEGNPVAISASLTVLAGTRHSPADIYVSGSLPVYGADEGLRDASGRLGLVATRQLFLPYWARTPGGNLDIDASLLALGVAADYGSGRFLGAISSFPASVHADNDAEPVNQGERLTVRGSVGGEAVDLSTNHFHEVVFEPDPRLLSNSPPYFPAFRARWSLRTVADISPADLCGSAHCPDWTSNTP